VDAGDQDVRLGKGQLSLLAAADLIPNATVAHEHAAITHTFQAFAKMISDRRSAEVGNIRVTNIVVGFSGAISIAITPFAAFASLLCFRVAGNELNIGNVFSTIALFLSIRFSCGLFFSLGVFSTHVVATVMQRVQLLLEDLEIANGPCNVGDVKESSLSRSWTGGFTIDIDSAFEMADHAHVQRDSNLAFQLSRAGFRWTADARSALHDISCDGPPGSLTIVVGPVGAGKSTLLLLLLRELAPQHGVVSVNCPAVYAPQQPWILSHSVRDNIVFGHQYLEDWYHQGECCATVHMWCL
jgi:ABC-type multidrug transport system fused ATPase/permease subunit